MKWLSSLVDGLRSARRHFTGASLKGGLRAIRRSLTIRSLKGALNRGGGALRRYLSTSPMHAALLVVLPSALLCWLLKYYQIVTMMTATGRVRRIWRLYLPELALFPAVLVVARVGLGLLPTRLHRPWLGAIAAALCLHALLVGMDVLAVVVRFWPLHYLELRQFLYAPSELWPVISSGLSEGQAAALVSAVVAVVAVHVLSAARALRVMPGLARRPSMHRWRSIGYAGLLVIALLGYFDRAQVRQPHRVLQPPTSERLIRGFLTEVEEDAAEVVVPESPRLEVGGGTLPPFNVVLVVLESTNRSSTTLNGPPKRASRLDGSSLNTPVDTTPQLRRLAQEGLEVYNTYIGASHSSKALTGILCGQYPYPDVRVLEASGILIDRCLAEILAAGGYQTGYFQAPRLEFEQRVQFAKAAGFQTVLGGDLLDSTGFEKVNYFGYEDRIVLKPALSWVTKQPGPYFLTVMTGTTHHPYGSPGRPPGGHGEKVETTRVRFDHSLAYVDDFLKALLEGIREARGLENTLVVVIGDHGEAFGEHGLRFHDWVPYEEGNRVPWVLWGPDVLTPERMGRVIPPGSRIDGLRHQVDFVPTVLELLGWPLRQGTLPGLSLWSTPGHERAWSSCWSANQCMAVRVGPLKYVVLDWGDLPEVYDVVNDPKEQHNLAATRPESELKAIRTELWQHKREWAARYMRVARRGAGKLEPPSAESVRAADSEGDDP